MTMIATFLTLVVVPVLYFLQQRFVTASGRLSGRLHQWYWGLYDRLAGTPEHRE